MHFSSFIGTLAYMALPLLLYCICGYFFLNRMLRVNLRKTYGFWVSLPIYLSAGIVLYTFILYVIGLVIFNESIVILLAIAIPLLFLGNLLLSAKRSGTTIRTTLGKLVEVNPRKLFNLPKQRSKLIPGLVLVASFLYLTIVVAIFEWPPVGDIISHGFYTSLIIYDQIIPTTFYPFVNWSMYYPFGLHVSAAFLALLLGIYPGEAVLLFGGILMIALTSLVFTLTFIITRSKLLSLSTYALTFLTYTAGGGGGDLEKWVFGYLFNGPYPNIYGFLIALLSITAVATYSKTKDVRILLRLFPILIIVLLLTYPSFVFVDVLLLIFVIFQVGLKKIAEELFRTKRDALLTVLLASAFIYFSLYIYFGIFAVQVSTGGELPAYAIQQSYLLGSVFGYSIIFAFVFSSLLIAISFMKRYRSSSQLFRRGELVELRPLFLTHVAISIVLFLSLNPNLYWLTLYFLPDRLAILAMMLSLVLNVYALSKIFDVLMEKRSRSAFLDRRMHTSAQKLQRYNARRRVQNSAPKRDVTLMKEVAVILTLFVFFSANGLLFYTVGATASFGLAEGYAWNTHNSWFNDDFNAMEWVYSNVKDGELILNDWSWDGLYITSLAALNVTMQYELAGLNRTKDLQNIWVSPQMGQPIYVLLKEYNVSYILTTGEKGYYDFLNGRAYKPKPCAPADYIVLFSSYSFLELVFKSGDSAIFRVK